MKRRYSIPVGEVFGDLTVLGEASRDGYASGAVRWLCRCICGTTVSHAGDRVRNGGATSCGCGKGKHVSIAKTRHGHARRQHGGKISPTYRSWVAMIGRCLHATHKDYPDYGARGITVCDRWCTFDNFLADMGDRPDGTTLDRYPNQSGNYEPGNCRWANKYEQARNTRSCYLTADIVNEIRGRWEHGEPQRSIARRMNIPWPNVNNVVRRVSWKDVP